MIDYAKIHMKAHDIAIVFAEDSDVFIEGIIETERTSMNSRAFLAGGIKFSVDAQRHRDMALLLEAFVKARAEKQTHLNPFEPLDIPTPLAFKPIPIKQLEADPS